MRTLVRLPFLVVLLLPVASRAAVAEPSASSAAGECGGEEDDDRDFEIDARLYTLWRLTNESDAPANEFALASLRVQGSWRPRDWVRGVLELEAEPLLASGSLDGMLRDAYVELSPFRWLEVRVGHFKRPFSHVELLPRRRLTTVDRGLVNRWVVGRLGYGDRDVGLGISGRIWEAARLDYAVGVFNGSGAGLVEHGGQGFKDFSARLEARPWRPLSFGLSVSVNTLEDDDLPYLVDPAIFAAVDPVAYPVGYGEVDFRVEHAWMVGTTWMAEADLAFRMDGWEVVAEAALGENLWFEGRPLTAGVTFVASYEFDLGDDPHVGLEPVFRGELVIPRIEMLSVRTWRAVAGVNLHLGRHVRIMVDGEFNRVEGGEPDEVSREGLWPGEWPGSWEDSECLRVQLALDV